MGMGVRVRKLKVQRRNNSRFFRNIFPKTDFLRSSSYRFFSKVASWTSALAVSACLVFSGCNEPESKRDYNIYFKRPNRYVLYQETSKHTPLWVGEGQILINYKENATDEQKQNVQNWLNNRGAKQVGYISGMETHQYELKKGTNLKEVINSLEKRDGVWVVAPNFKFKPLLDPKPNLSKRPYDGHWWIDTIKLRQAWDITTGSENIPIGIVDDGRLRTESGHFKGKKITYAITCLSQTSEGKNFTTVYKPGDEPGVCAKTLSLGTHSTHVSAILAADGNDNIGGAGVAWKNPIIYSDVGPLDYISRADIEGAIQISIKMGAKVINVSMGACYGEAGDTKVDCDKASPRVKDLESFRKRMLPAAKSAYENDVLIVFAAGNKGPKNDDNWLPSDVDQTNVKYFKNNTIFVGGTDDWNNPMCSTDYLGIMYPLCDDNRNKYTCKCRGCGYPKNDQKQYYYTVEGKVVELAAPGYWIARFDTKKSDGSFLPMWNDGNSKGTSNSAAMVSGAAALAWGVNTNLKPSQVKQILLKSAQKRLGKCHDIGHGILDVEAAVKMAKTYSTSPVTTWTKFTGTISYVTETSDSGYAYISDGHSELIKIDRNGTKQWSTFVNTHPRDLMQTSDGALALVTNEYGGGPRLEKYSNSGKSLLSKSLKDAFSLTAHPSYGTFNTTNDAGFIFVFGSKSPHNTIPMVKTDSKLNKVWLNTPTTTAKSLGTHPKIRQLKSGDYMVLNNASRTKGGRTLWVAKLNSTGSVLWEKTFSEFSQPSTDHLLHETSGGMIVHFDAKPYIFKVDTDGKGIWKADIPSSFYTNGMPVSGDVTNDGGYVFGGCPSGKGTVIGKLDSNGSFKWKKEIKTDYKGNGCVRYVLEVNDGGFLIHVNERLIKTDKNGEVK